VHNQEFHLSEPLLFSIGRDVVLTAWDEKDAATGPLEIAIDGAPLLGRRASLRLGGPDGHTRMVLALQLPEGATGPIALARGDKPVATIALRHDELETPSLLVEGLDGAARSRLLGFMFGVCRSALRLSSDPGFIDFCRTLLRAALPGDVLSFAPRARLIGGNALYAAPAHLSAVGNFESVYLMDDRRIVENPVRSASALSDEEHRILLIAPLRFSRGVTTAILIADGHALCAAMPPVHDAPGVMELGPEAALTGGERLYVLRSLGELADDPDSVALARALQIFAPERIRDLADTTRPVAAALEFAFSCGRAGVFVRGWVRDPHKLVGAVDLVSPFGEARLSSCWQRVPRPDLNKAWKETASRDSNPGFVALAPVTDPLPVMQHSLRLQTAGGPILVTPAARAPSDAEARDMILRCVSEPELTDDLLERVIAPAAADLHQRVMASQGAPEIIDIGPGLADSKISFIIPLYRNLSFLRLQIGAFAIDDEIRRDAELVYVLDSPDQRREVEHLLRGLNILTGLSFRLVVMSGNFGYAAANNTGARAARGTNLMLLNSDVIPLGPHWLRALRAALEQQDGARKTGAVGPKLLFDDGSLQHAGLIFERDPQGRWYNTHLFKGYPRDWPAANQPRIVPGVTGAAMLMPRAVFESVGGFTETYIVGDYEDSDLCLKIREQGFDIRYEPRASLYHFERRSIELHPGYSGTAASAYNRRLHSARWSDSMAAAMDNFARGKDAVVPARDTQPAVAARR
jgi:O-antigen biosynthesis protein